MNEEIMLKNAGKIEKRLENRSGDVLGDVGRDGHEHYEQGNVKKVGGAK